MQLSGHILRAKSEPDNPAVTIAINDADDALALAIKFRTIRHKSKCYQTLIVHL